MKIIVGGNAFENKKDLYIDIGADYYLQTYEDIATFAKGVDLYETSSKYRYQIFEL